MIEWHLRWALSEADRATAEQISIEHRQAIAKAIDDVRNAQMEEFLFGGRVMPNQVAVTEAVVLAPRKPRKHPFGIINFEDVVG